MNRCHLQNRRARKVVATVWRHLRQKFPADARILSGIVRRILPLTETESADDTCGQWLQDGFTSADDEWRFCQRYPEHGQAYGIMKLLDGDQLTVGTVAHEMGHAFTSYEDLEDRQAPTDEWASEAAADMHACRWGLLSCAEIRNRHASNVDGIEGNYLAACFHHGPPPDGPWIEYLGSRWRLTADFVFERAQPAN